MKPALQEDRHIRKDIQAILIYIIEPPYCVGFFMFSKVLSANMPAYIKRKGGQVGMETWQLNLAPFMPAGISEAVLNIKGYEARNITEIRFRAERPILLQALDRVYALKEDGSLTNDYSKGIIAKKEDCENTLLYMAKRSLYAFQEEIKNGFITVKGTQTRSLGRKKMDLLSESCT